MGEDWRCWVSWGCQGLSRIQGPLFSFCLFWFCPWRSCQTLPQNSNIEQIYKFIFQLNLKRTIFPGQSFYIWRKLPSIENYKYYWKFQVLLNPGKPGKTVDRLLKFSTQCWVSFGSHKCPVLRHYLLCSPRIFNAKQFRQWGESLHRGSNSFCLHSAPNYFRPLMH